MKIIKKYYREFIIVALIIILGFIFRWNYLAKKYVEDIKSENDRIKSELQIILDENAQNDIKYSEKRDSLLRKLDSLQALSVPKKKELNIVIDEIKDLSVLQNKIINTRKDSIWKTLKESNMQ